MGFRHLKIRPRCLYSLAIREKKRRGASQGRRRKRAGGDSRTEGRIRISASHMTCDVVSLILNGKVGDLAHILA